MCGGEGDVEVAKKLEGTPLPGLVVSQFGMAFPPAEAGVMVRVLRRWGRDGGGHLLRGRSKWTPVLAVTLVVAADMLPSLGLYAGHAVEGASPGARSVCPGGLMAVVVMMMGVCPFGSGFSRTIAPSTPHPTPRVPHLSSHPLLPAIFAPSPVRLSPLASAGRWYWICRTRKAIGGGWLALLWSRLVLILLLLLLVLLLLLGVAGGSVHHLLLCGGA